MHAAVEDTRNGRSVWLAEVAATLKLGWPMILTQIAQTAMTATGTVMLGRVGPEAIAAASLALTLYFLPMIMGMGLILATAPMVASELGRKRSSVRDVRRTVRQGLWIAFFAVLPIWLLLWHAGAILAAMGQPPALAAEAGHYMRALQWALLPFYFYIVLRCFLAAMEKPGWTLVVAFCGIICNAFLSWCLIFGRLGFPELGILGSGIAVTVSNTLMFLGMVAVVSLHRKFRRYSLFGRIWRPDWPRFLALLKIGLPIAAILAFEISVFNAATFFMGLVSETALAAHAIAMQIASLSFMVPMGLAQAVTVRVARAHGARNPVGVTRAGWVAYALSAGFMATMGILMVVIPEVLIGGFLDLSNPANHAVVQTASTFLFFAALFQIFDGIQAVAAGMLRGLNDTTVPMVYAAVGYWGVGLTLSIGLGFGLGMGGVGIWIGLVAGLVIVAMLLTYRWLNRYRLGLI
ncbi:MATE family efflux transporter [Limoniibacter endophyticus]|uniref:Multidrug-efflux transporter n=1 Tax=Limoniibacter endophyticus TaxID=1565040 RepID=A0A8J3DLN8_9HYPH|nr:MATE family efflux transporter [Limoniibacter endophyticus]GHC80144.1 MATE family efflux transporter [Limoniibacter endophyticus]